MSITSFSFLALLAVGVFVYYLTPGKVQWIVLLGLSLVFYWCSGFWKTIVYLLISAASAYCAGLVMLRQRGSENRRASRAALWIAIGIHVALWFLIKGKDFWAPPAVWLLNHVYIDKLNTLVYMQLWSALGMGYYTLQMIGYLIDCYWENVVPQRNPLKLFLFTAYFPQLTTGPISRYAQMETLYAPHRFSYQNLCFGCQRILWGFLKKLILAESVGKLVSGLMAREFLMGFETWVVILLYPIQMYADFSGCMDIILGASELFDIRLAENFRNPFFSRTVQEFWQRWHITLGTWAKDYVLYPLLKTKTMVGFGKACRKRFGKKKGKFLTTVVAMLAPWLIIGIWHGGWQHVVGVSLWHWFFLMLGELTAPTARKVTTALHMKTESFSWHLFQSCRTYLIFAVGATFFHAGVPRALELLGQALGVFWKEDCYNPWIFFNGSLLETGITHGTVNLILVMVGMLLIVGVLREKYGYARNWVADQSFVFRWLIWICLFVFLLIWGSYGPGYSAAQFIYQGF